MIDFFIPRSTTSVLEPALDELKRNPTIIPQKVVARKGCPKCESMEFGGRNVGGVITFTCRTCRNQWSGGLPQEPMDPSVPHPAVNPLTQPSVGFSKNKEGNVVEERRTVNTTQTYRKGAPAPSGDDDV